MESISPFDGCRLRQYEELSEPEVEERVQLSWQAARRWRETTLAERSERLEGMARSLRAAQEELAREMVVEMGKPIEQARSEVEKCAWVCDYFAENGGRFLAQERMEADAAKSYVRFDPLGVILAVMPWNFPFWQVFRCAAPNLIAGNGILLKHASNVCGCALLMERLFQEIFPKGLFSVLLISSRRVEGLVENERIAAVTLTGSPRAGRSVAAAAGQCLKKTVLELGGSDPYLILEGADIERAAAVCAASRLINSGQSCIAAKRFLVEKRVAQPFVEAFRSELAKRTVGDPMEESSAVGPLARKDLREQLHQQVEESVRGGAKLVLGGRMPEGPGAFYPITLLESVGVSMPVFCEETFGPVAAVTEVAGEAEAIELANASRYGLGAAVFTSDLEQGERVAGALEAGNCFINSLVQSDPRLPFGGVKESGYGRELGLFGIREFVNIKTVYAA